MTTLAPNIRAKGVHDIVTPAATRATCLGCHETEAEAVVRIERLAHAGKPAPTPGPGDAPLVQDWMAQDKKGCVDCHRVRGGQ
ncbi:MAG: hypothetical protein ACPG4T_20780 [Nannocystaceae bacterium]